MLIKVCGDIGFLAPSKQTETRHEDEDTGREQIEGKSETMTECRSPIDRPMTGNNLGNMAPCPSLL